MVESLPDSVRLALGHSGDDHNQHAINSADLLLLDPTTIAMLSGELSKNLMEDQILQILRGFLQRQKFREAAQVVEIWTSRLSGIPDLMINLWNEQQYITNSNQQVMNNTDNPFCQNCKVHNQTVSIAAMLQGRPDIPPPISETPDTAGTLELVFAQEEWL